MSLILLGLAVMCWGGEQREPAFAQAAQGAEQRVASTGIGIEVTPVRGLPDRDVHADASAVVSGIG